VLLVAPALKVLAGNIDELSKVVEEDITPQLSPEGAEILAGDADEDADDEPIGGGPAGAGPAEGGPADEQRDDKDDIFY